MMNHLRQMFNNVTTLAVIAGLVAITLWLVLSRGQAPQPLSFAYAGQGIALGRHDADGQPLLLSPTVGTVRGTRPAEMAKDLSSLDRPRLDRGYPRPGGLTRIGCQAPWPASREGIGNGAALPSFPKRWSRCRSAQRRIWR